MTDDSVTSSFGQMKKQERIGSMSSVGAVFLGMPPQCYIQMELDRDFRLDFPSG